MFEVDEECRRRRRRGPSCCAATHPRRCRLATKSAGSSHKDFGRSHSRRHSTHGRRRRRRRRHACAARAAALGPRSLARDEAGSALGGCRRGRRRRRPAHPSRIIWPDEAGRALCCSRNASLTSGTTWHAAGLVGQLRATKSETMISAEAVDVYNRLGGDWAGHGLQAMRQPDDGADFRSLRGDEAERRTRAPTASRPSCSRQASVTRR